jgi:cell division protease FtsH
MNKLKKKYIIFPLITAVLSLAVLIFVNNSNLVNKTKAYNDFLVDMQQENITTVYLTNTSNITVRLKDGTVYRTDNPKSVDFKENLLTAGVTVAERAPSGVKEVLPAVTLGLSLLAVLFIFLKTTAVRSKGLFGVDALDSQAVSDSKYNFNSVAGNEEAKESVKDIVDFLKNPEKYARYGARMPRGIILYGDPGTGKTLLAKAVAGEAGVPFFAMSGSDFVQVYVGVGASRIRSLFKKAKSHGKAVIFIDEIDAIGKARDAGKNGGSDERDQTLNALLTEMSGFNENEGIIVMAATNRLDMLDSALLRPGRFDRHIEVMLPDVSAREKILSLHFKNKPVQDLDIRDWALKTAYFSGAKLESLTNEAAILACKDNSNFITDLHMDKAFSIVIAGHEKIDREGITEKDKKITAYHEAGHALVSLLMLPEDKISKVTIIPSSKGAGGYTLSIPEDKLYQNMAYLKNRIMVLLGGRAAEEIIFGKEYVTTGAYSDLKHTTNMITKMITEYGMGDTLGLLSFQEASSLAGANSQSIIEEAKTTVNELYEATKDLLMLEKTALEDMTKALLQRETLYAEDMNKYKKVKN